MHGFSSEMRSISITVVRNYTLSHDWCKADWDLVRIAALSAVAIAPGSVTEVERGRYRSRFCNGG